MPTISNGIASRGYATRSPNGKLAPFNFMRRPVGKADVLIDIMYCGICHSDIHSARSEWRGSAYPVVPGHEIVGKVSAVGQSVRKFRKGDIVGVGCMVGSCGKCKYCKEGHEYNCVEGGPIWTYGSYDKHTKGHTFGGYSNNIVVDQGFVLRIPKGMDLARTAPLMCAGTTTYTPLSYWKVKKGQTVGVLGLGGLGHVAVKIAKSMGAKVIVLTSSKNKVKDALRLGASAALLTSDRKQMERHNDSFDLIIDTVSADHDVNSFMPLLKLDGKLVLVGLPSSPLKVAAFSIVGGHRALAGSGLGGVEETQQMLDYCAKHGIAADIELIPIQKVNEAYDRIVKGDVKYRFVIDLKSLKK
ncbi:MAG: NAD(P)-dependent alcohol dehydrogenase [Candidatus Micrarchaeota archaeon]|nr:NAD(P)-dependent alcohol dehydrogenase [Candidatus Micrarchaeota archaeon]